MDDIQLFSDTRSGYIGLNFLMIKFHLYLLLLWYRSQFPYGVSIGKIKMLFHLAGQAEE